MKTLRFALLGDDPLLGSLVDQFTGQGHSLIWSDAPSAESSSSSDSTPRELWESLLEGNLADLVLVGRGDPDVREDQLRRLVQARIPVIVAHGEWIAPLVCYELDMIRRDNGCFLRNYYPGQRHPQLMAISEMMRAGDDAPWGDVEQVTFERSMADRSKSSALDQLSRDIDQIITLCGTQNSVSAWGTGQGDAAYAGLSVQFTGPCGFATRWFVRAPQELPGSRLIVNKTAGRFELEMPDDPAEWKLAILEGARPVVDRVASVITHRDEAASLAEEVLAHQASDEAGAAGVLAARQSGAKRDTLDLWFQACQSIDLLDATQRSLAKGRTIELHFEDYSSAATFKGRMAAIGCATLMLGLLTCLCGFFGDMISGIYRQMIGKAPAPATRWWPWALLVALLVFLFIQVLPKLLPEPRADQEHDDDPSVRK